MARGFLLTGARCEEFRNLFYAYTIRLKWYNREMKKTTVRILAFLLAGLTSVAGAGDAGLELSGEDFYVGCSAAMVLPEGGGDMRRMGGCTVRGGFYFAEFWALDCELSLYERTAAMSASALWHWWGYERFDPFFRFGAKGWCGRRDEAGPMGGVGAFSHLTDNLSLRFDADAVLSPECAEEMVYSLSTGVQWSF